MLKHTLLITSTLICVRMDIIYSSLGEVKFPNYGNFINLNDAYSKVIQKLMEVINKVVPVKNKKIKINFLE